MYFPVFTFQRRDTAPNFVKSMHLSKFSCSISDKVYTVLDAGTVQLQGETEENAIFMESVANGTLSSSSPWTFSLCSSSEPLPTCIHKISYWNVVGDPFLQRHFHYGVWRS